MGIFPIEKKENVKFTLFLVTKINGGGGGNNYRGIVRVPHWLFLRHGGIISQ
jgi:hypothetical protein